ncbi:hypothetical protein [Saccharothrix variisporea]|uniref:TetR family transcriptional regulator n=1 Tax=Saccharothrix variisporea TaxID=543527 RepID=A0A495XKZ4_9PSEU|nr:hypothetical protein [Saccharothrix variisporea]RKT74552.1 hypothetical protein DFJ66_7914 [Saccharothrix variisporea]
MGWAEFYRRRDVLFSALAQVARDGTLVFDRVSGAREVFAGVDDLVLALHHRWSLLLQARIDLALSEPGDPADAVTRAWLALAADEPVLRAVLDAHEHDPVLADAIARENRVLALDAGLTHPNQHVQVITEIGHALRASLRPSAAAPLRPGAAEALRSRGA